METPASSEPAGSVLFSLLLACGGALAATLLGAAYHLGLFYQLVHKVWTPPGKQAGGEERGLGARPPLATASLQGGRARGGCAGFAGALPQPLVPGAPRTLPLGGDH